MLVRKCVLLLASVSLAVVFLSVALSRSTPVVAQTSTAKPNIVFILTDDMRYDDLKYMPKTRKLLGTEGMRFKSAFVSTPLCCPSRATIMRGQYAHNTGVWFNKIGPPESTGWSAYKSNGNEKDNVATRLHDAGYRTGLFGKYLNGYSGTSVPPGWVDWFAMRPPRYFNYVVNDNGTIRHYGSKSSDYQTDVIRMQTQQFIGASVAKHKPFFAYVTPKAPHDAPVPAPRDRHTYDGEQAPRPPSFYEDDVSDKPPWIRNKSPLSPEQVAQIDTWHEGRVEALQAVDDLVAGVDNKLRKSGVLHNTYIFFSSDNGVQLGEHRLTGKPFTYEESIHMPLLIRGPGVAKMGSFTNKLTLNTDFLPTFTDLAGIKTPGYVDGRSLRPLLEGTKSPWRTAILFEYHKLKEDKTSYGIRTASQKYVEYDGGFRELYDLKNDPYELSNSYDAARAPTTLVQRLQALKVCAKASCRAAENGQ